MSAIAEMVEIGVPVRIAYNQWTQFKSFPRFLAAVRTVDQLRPSVTCWVIGLGPLRREFDVEIVQQDPDCFVAWWCLGRHHRHRGEVTFQSLGPHRTEVIVRIQYEPHGLNELLGAALGVPRRIVRSGLGQFKDFIECLGEEDGAWRGSISKGRVQPVESKPPRSRVPTWPHG